MSAPEALPSRRARAEASAWIAKLHGPDRTDALERDFRSWLAVDPEHARAFEHITEVWEGIRQVNTGGLPRLASLETFEPPARARRWPLLAAAACVVLVVGTLSLLSLTDHSYETRLGDQRIVTLEDGSRLYLNSQTKIDVSFADDARRVELLRGEAYFEVAKDKSRPFIVDAGGRYVTALGTAFVVRLEPHQVAVTLVEGKVSVTSEGTVPVSTSDGGARASEANAVILSPGERVIVSERSGAVIDTPRSDATAAWRRGEVVLDETPLGLAVTELNRYQRRQLVIADAHLARLPVSGTYQIGNNLDFAHAVALLYGLQVSEQGEDIRLSRAR